MSPDFPQLLTPSEAARLFGVNVRTINRYVQQGRLHALHTPGGHSRFLLAELERFAAAEAARHHDKTTAS